MKKYTVFGNLILDFEKTVFSESEEKAIEFVKDNCSCQDIEVMNANFEELSAEY